MEKDSPSLEFPLFSASSASIFNGDADVFQCRPRRKGTSVSLGSARFSRDPTHRPFREPRCPFLPFHRPPREPPSLRAAVRPLRTRSAHPASPPCLSALPLRPPSLRACSAPLFPCVPAVCLLRTRPLAPPIPAGRCAACGSPAALLPPPFPGSLRSWVFSLTRRERAIYFRSCSEQRKGTKHEAHLSAEYSQAGEDPRFPRPHVDQGWPQGSGRAPREGPQAPVRVGETRDWRPSSPPGTSPICFPMASVCTRLTSRS